MKNKGELTLDALRAMRAVYGGPNNDSWHRTLAITGDENFPDTPARAVGTARLLGRFDRKLDMCPLVYELVIYKSFVVYRNMNEHDNFVGSRKMTHREGLSWFINKCWEEFFCT